MLQKKHINWATIILFLAIILGFNTIPLHTTHAQVISNIINQIIDTVAPSIPTQNQSQNSNPVIITPAAVNVPIQSIIAPAPSVIITTPSQSPVISVPVVSTSPLVTVTPRPTPAVTPSSSPSPRVTPATSQATTAATTTASTTTATSTQATTTPAGIVGNPNNTISGSATNYYTPLNNFSPVTTVGLSLFAVLIGIVGALSILKVPPQRKSVLAGGYSPRTVLQVQEPLLNQQK